MPAVAAYDRCGRTTYAPANTAKNIVGLTAEGETDSVACGGYTAGSPASVPGSVNTLTAPAAVSRPAQVVSATRSFYDDPTWSTTFPQTAAPTKGELTMIRKADDYTGGAFTWQTTSRTNYDGYGRVVDSYDAKGNQTHMAYTMNAVGLTTGVATTNPLNQTNSKTVSPARGLDLTTNDINGRVVTATYDALGRLTAVWLPSRSTSATANYLFTYAVSNTSASTTTTRTLNDAGGYRTSTDIYDGLLRKRQTQAMTAAGGRMVTDTLYDTRGWVRQRNNGWWDPATTPNTTLVAPTSLNPVSALPSQDSYVYDGLGRVVYDQSLRDNQVVSTTITVYNGNRVTTIPPTGGITTATITDPVGHTVEFDQYSAAPTLHTPANPFTGSFYLTGGTTTAVTYGFDAHHNQNTVTEPGPHTWTSTHNLLGQVTASTDPDGGTSSMLYDANGNLIQATDARSKTVSYTVDALNRRTGQYASAVGAQSAANQLAKWVYDNSDNAVPTMQYAKGQQTSATAYRNGNAYTVQQKDFNVFGHSLGTTVTIPSVEGNLAGTYTFSHVYTATAGLPLKDIYPSGGGLPAETVLHGYTTAMDLPNALSGLIGYGQGISYDAWGRVAQASFNPLPNQATITNTWDPHTGRLTDSLLTRAVATPSRVDEQAYTYDLGGNVVMQQSSRLGSASPSETQCYRYNPLDQLAQAWTATDACSATPTTASHAMVGDPLGASSAYWTSWDIDGLANRTGQTVHNLGTGVDTTTSYAYNGNGANQPHTLTSTTTTGATTGSTSYGYDQAGNMTSRNTGAGNQTLVWNDAGQLTAINGSTTGNTTFLYDGNGNLLLQKDPGITTLYLPGQQHTLNATTGTVTGTRYYTLPGVTCIRTGGATNAYTYAVMDRHGTPALYLDNTAQTPTWRQYTPYGAPRGAATTAPDNRGFLDKQLNTATGLTQVGARNYDPQTGRFISLDPVFDAGNPQQLNGYSYTGANPITQSDPTGTRPADCDGDCLKNWATAQYAAIRQRRGDDNWCLPVGTAGPCAGSRTYCSSIFGCERRSPPTCSLWELCRTPRTTPTIPAQPTGPDLTIHQFDDNPYGMDCYVSGTGGCGVHEGGLYVVCSDRDCSNYESADSKCSRSFLCVFLNVMEIVGWVTFAYGPGAGKEIGEVVIEHLREMGAEKAVSILPGVEIEDEVPSRPEDLDASFTPVLLGFDTALYQSTAIDQTRNKNNPVYSSKPPVRTATQATGHEVIIPKGTIVWVAYGIGENKVVVVPPGTPEYEGVSWPLE